MDLAALSRIGRAAGAVAAFAVAACGGGERGAAVVAGMRWDFTGFNPLTTTDQYGVEVINFALYTPLVQYDDTLGIRPALAASWDAWGDTAIVFRLRRDVLWHDGRPVTAGDVVFTFERAKAPETASLLGQAFLADVAHAEAIDSFTVRFRYARPHAQALEDFWWAPAPRHLLADIPPADLRNASFNRAPVGSGPYRLVAWQANDRLVFEPNPAYPAALGGPPAGRLVFRIVPEASTMLTELITGGVHVDLPVPPDQVERIRAEPRLTLHAFPGRTVYYLGCNHARPPFDDARVRRALALAIDRQQVIDGLLAGQGEIALSTIPPWHPLHPRDIAPLPFSLEESDRLLRAAGWQDRDGDGIRENEQGRPLRFTLLAADDPLRRSVVEVLERQLRRAGALVEIRVTEFQTMLAQHRGRDFDAVFTNWILDNFRVASAPFALFHSSQADVERSANRSSVRNAALDHWIEEGGAATDPVRQREVWREFTRLLQDEQPVTFMFWLNELAASGEAVEGVVMDPRGELHAIARWRLRQ